MGFGGGWDGCCLKEELGAVPSFWAAMVTDRIEVGREYSEAGGMGKYGSVESWEGAC